MKIVHAALCATLLLWAVPGLSRAGTATVRVSDLDTRTKRGAATLDRRLASAIERVCGSYAGADMSEMDSITRCRRAARADVASQRAGRGLRESARLGSGAMCADRGQVHVN